MTEDYKDDMVGGSSQCDTAECDRPSDVVYEFTDDVGEHRKYPLCLPCFRALQLGKIVAGEEEWDEGPPDAE